MASALQEPRSPSLVEDDPRNEDVPMNGEWTDPLPDRYAFREIDFGMDAAGHLQFSFSNHLLARALPLNGIDAVIDELLAEPLMVSPGAFSTAVNLMDPDTPLDLEVTGRPIYIVLRLRRPKNMEFSPELKAVSHKRSADMPYYGGLRHVSATQREQDPIADCKLIYFIAKPPTPARTPYEHEFNFNVWLIQSPRVGSTIRRVLKLQIDPDVRFPGGSGVGEGP